MSDRNNGVIGPVIGAGIILAILIAIGFLPVPSAHAQGTGGAAAPSQLNPNVTVTIDVTQDWLIGSVAMMYDGTTFVDCDDCGEIATIFRGKKTYFKLRMTKTQQFVRGMYVYQQIDKYGKFAWRGKTLVANDWDGGRLNGKTTVRIGGRKVKMGLVSATAQVHDTTKLEVPVKNGTCDSRVVDCPK